MVSTDHPQPRRGAKIQEETTVGSVWHGGRRPPPTSRAGGGGVRVPDRVHRRRRSHFVAKRAGAGGAEGGLVGLGGAVDPCTSRWQRRGALCAPSGCGQLPNGRSRPSRRDLAGPQLLEADASDDRAVGLRRPHVAARRSTATSGVGSERPPRRLHAGRSPPAFGVPPAPCCCIIAVERRRVVSVAAAPTSKDAARFTPTTGTLRLRLLVGALLLAQQALPAVADGVVDLVTGSCATIFDHLLPNVLTPPKIRSSSRVHACAVSAAVRREHGVRRAIEGGGGVGAFRRGERGAANGSRPRCVEE